MLLMNIAHNFRYSCYTDNLKWIANSLVFRDFFISKLCTIGAETAETVLFQHKNHNFIQNTFLKRFS